MHFPRRCLPLDCNTHCANILAHTKKRGRPISVENAQIAAITISNKLTLATRNSADFDVLDQLPLVNPWRP